MLRDQTKMGIDHYFYLFIGRPCTKEEQEQLFKKLLDVNNDDDIQEMYERLSLGEADSYWQLDGFNVRCIGRFEDIGKTRVREDEFEFYVEQYYIDKWSHRDESNPISFGDWPKPHDERYGLMRAYDVSC